MGLANPRLRWPEIVAPALLLFGLQLPLRLAAVLLSLGQPSLPMPWRQGLRGVLHDLSAAALLGALTLLVTLLTRPLHRLPAAIVRLGWCAALTGVLAWMTARVAGWAAGWMLPLELGGGGWAVRADLWAWLADPWHKVVAIVAAVLSLMVLLALAAVVGAAAANVREVRPRATWGVVLLLLLPVWWGAQAAAVRWQRSAWEPAESHPFRELAAGLRRAAVPAGAVESGARLLDERAAAVGGAINPGFVGRHTLAAGAPSIDRPVLPGRPHVVLLVLEGAGLSALAGTGELAPFLSGLKSGGITLGGHLSTATATAGAELSLLCGVQPPPRMTVLPQQAPPLRCLSHLLGDAGYDTSAVLATPAGRAGRAPFLRAQGVRQVWSAEDAPPEAPRHGAVLQDDAVADRLLQELESAQGPRFVYALAASTRGLPPPHARFADAALGLGALEPEQRGWRYADDVWRRFFERARQRPWFERTLFVVVGAHGAEGLTPGDARHPTSVAAQRARHEMLALLLHPALTARRVAAGSHLDIAPTVAGLLGLTGPLDAQGDDRLRPGALSPAFASVEQGVVPRYRLQTPEGAFWRSPAEGLCERLDPLRPPAPCGEADVAVAARWEAALLHATGDALGTGR